MGLVWGLVRGWCLERAGLSLGPWGPLECWSPGAVGWGLGLVLAPVSASLGNSLLSLGRGGWGWNSAAVLGQDRPMGACWGAGGGALVSRPAFLG